jgi:hypothetical protein
MSYSILIQPGFDIPGAFLVNLADTEPPQGLSLHEQPPHDTNVSISLKIEPHSVAAGLKLSACSRFDNGLAPKNALAAPGEWRIESKCSTSAAEEILRNTDQAHQWQVDIAKKTFVSKLCNLASVGALSLIQLAQFLNLKEKEEINTGTAVVSLIALGVATADCVAALADYMSKKGGGKGLVMGANSVAGVVQWVGEKCGASREASKKSANIISTVARTGLMVTQLAQSFGKMTVQGLSKLVELPQNITDFASGLSGNISDAALKQIPWTKIALEQVAGLAQGISKGQERAAHELAGVQKEQNYKLDATGVVQAHGIITTLSTIGKTVALSTSSCIAKQVSIVLNVINGVGKAVEGQAKRMQPIPLIGRFV